MNLPMMHHNASRHPGFQTTQEMWDSVPTALAHCISRRLPDSHISVRHHKAEVTCHGEHILVSQRCKSFRPAVHLGDQLQAVIYFGMGTLASHDASYNLVCFTYTLQPLRAVQACHVDPASWCGQREVRPYLLRAIPST